MWTLVHADVSLFIVGVCGCGYMLCIAQSDGPDTIRYLYPPYISSLHLTIDHCPPTALPPRLSTIHTLYCCHIVYVCTVLHLLSSAHNWQRLQGYKSPPWGIPILYFCSLLWNYPLPDVSSWYICCGSVIVVTLIQYVLLMYIHCYAH